MAYIIFLAIGHMLLLFLLIGNKVPCTTKNALIVLGIITTLVAAGIYK